MKNTILFIILVLLHPACSRHTGTIDIVISENASKIENLAAKELQHYLEIIYPYYQFPVTLSAMSKWRIYVGRKENIPDGLLHQSTIPLNDEGFSIYNNDSNTGVITSSGGIGLLYGVYELLEKMGYSYVFSGDYAPSEKENFNFENWDIVNEPLVAERTVFNWHNFLSGCTAWDYEDWTLWIDQSQKMGYNTIMVHGYANNPMFTFEYNGFTKPVGYLTTSVQGRDWSTEHVNDVRRLPGGHVFNSSVFGSKAGIVPDDKKVEAIQQMMRRVFQHAEDRGMKVNIALDFDMVAAIPQEMVATIPETDKFLVEHKGIDFMGEKAGKVWLPRPDKPEGYNYYKKQVATLLDLYPQIDKYVLWRRATGSVYQELKRNEMPKDWQKEFVKALEINPKIAKMPNAEGAFAQSKLAYAYRDAFKELNRDDVAISYGTWRWTSLEPMNEFFSDFTTIYILDSEVIRGEMHMHNQTMINDIATWAKPGKIIPVIWPHHDDGAYIGSSLAPFKNLHQTLTQLKSNGFGVIHWMTRPFDTFFIHHAKQVMSCSRNQPMEETLNDVGEKWFGSVNSKVMTTYLNLVGKDMPIFGRETGSTFIDKPHYFKFDNVEKVISQCNERLELLESVNTEVLSKDQEQMYLYFVNFESFIQEFYRQQGLFLTFREKFETGSIDAARDISDQFQPEKVLEQYAKTIKFGQTTKGEQGLLFSMGTRWLPHFLTMKQLVGKESIRINFAPTSHEDLAQMAGKLTYFIDSDNNYWKVQGEKETGKTVVDISDNSDEYEELFKKGILLDSNMTIKLNSFSGNENIIVGKYILKMLLTSKEQDSRLEVRINDSIYDVAINKPTIKSINIFLDGQSNPEIEFMPHEGTAIVCGLVLEIR